MIEMGENGIEITEQIRLDNINFYQEKILKMLDNRYQWGVIIIPTIVGLWGFIGLIITSKLFEKQWIFFYGIITLGIFITNLLVYMWRIHVHDIMKEELEYGRQLIKIEADLICENKSKQEINYAIERDLTYETRKFHYMGVPWGAFHNSDGKVYKEFEECYGYLRKNKKIYDFFEKYYAKLGQKSLDGIDLCSQIGICAIGVFGIFLLMWSPLIPPMFLGQIIFILVISVSTVLILWKFITLWKSSHLQKEDFEKYKQGVKE
jgi:hypothetical protein